MILHLLTPIRTVVLAPVSKIVAEAPNGSFGLLPRHTDFLSTLVPGLLMYVAEFDSNTQQTSTDERTETYVACDAGLLVKQGDRVMISVRQAFEGSDLGTLRETVERKFAALDERSRMCQSAIASLEANFLRRLLEMENTG